MSSHQVVRLAKEGFSVEEIVEDLGYDRENVELILAGNKKAKDTPLAKKFEEWIVTGKPSFANLTT